MDSTRLYLPQSYGVAVEPTPGWTAIFGPTSTEDGPAILNPYELEEFQVGDDQTESFIDPDVIPLSKDVRNGGRIFSMHNVGCRLELWPLFSQDGATATVQLFGFDWVQRNDPGIPGDFNSFCTFPHPRDASGALGLAYPICRDDSLGPQTFTFEAIDGGETQQVSVTALNQPYPDSEGEVYTVGIRHIFNRTGFYGLFAWVTDISAGNFLLLARVI